MQIETGWFMVNVVVPALAPGIGAAIMIGMEKITEGDRDISLADPYIDGQLGYVSVGWCAAALLEIDHLQHCFPAAEYGGMHTGVWILLVLGGLIAAAGSIKTDKPDHTISTGRKRNGRILAFGSSLVVSVVTLALLLVIHTSQGGPQCH
ncbi:hypothetical protein [Paraburkholderia flagellata]|uniref:hypothetical protein n=1 Tax=Paraburkholderia flagellata TaxID=2883241 RepID=UPI001F20A9F9|nr:hypothetical protein [Paraburkholderia flagellata]